MAHLIIRSSKSWIQSIWYIFLQYVRTLHAGIRCTQLPLECLLDPPRTPSFDLMPPHEVVLKAGCAMINMKNYTRIYGVLGGTRLNVKQIYSNCIEAQILAWNSSTFRGREVLIGKIAIKCMDIDCFGPIMNRVQFPFRLSLAMTIKISQALALKQFGRHLATQVCSHSQLYVVLSGV